jgi:tetratricopeptide (TPR) repeat protein
VAAVEGLSAFREKASLKNLCKSFQTLMKNLAFYLSAFALGLLLLPACSEQQEAETYLAKAAPHLRNKNFDEAIACYNAALAAKPDSLLRMDIYSSRGYAYLLKGDSTTAISCYEKAIACKPLSALRPQDVELYKSLHVRLIELYRKHDDSVQANQIQTQLATFDDAEQMKTDKILGNWFITRSIVKGQTIRQADAANNLVFSNDGTMTLVKDGKSIQTYAWRIYHGGYVLNGQSLTFSETKNGVMIATEGDGLVFHLNREPQMYQYLKP